MDPPEFRHKIGALVSFVVLTVFFALRDSRSGLLVALVAMLEALKVTVLYFFLFALVESWSKRFRVLQVAGFFLVYACAKAVVAYTSPSPAETYFPSPLKEYGPATYVGILWATGLAFIAPYLLGVFGTEVLLQRRERRRSAQS